MFIADWLLWLLVAAVAWAGYTVGKDVGYTRGYRAAREDTPQG